MAKLHIEDLVLNVLVNGDPARKKMLDLANQIKDDNVELKEMRKHLSGIENLMGGKGSDAYKKQAAAIKQHEESIKASRQQLKGMMDDLKTDSLTIAELKDRIKDLSNRLKDIAPGTEEWKNFNARLQETKARLKELQAQGAQTEGVLKRFWTSAAGAVAMVQAGWAVLLRVARGLRGAFDTLKDFEQANVNLATILGKNVQEISALTDEAERLGSTTRYTASQVTGLQTELAKLGFTENQISLMSEPVLNFATALGVDLSEAAALSGAALRMFGLRASDTDDTLGALVISTNKSALNFSYLQTALSIVGPVARTFGFDIKDTTALLGALANAGFDASSAATATRNILLNLANSNGKLAKSLGGPVKTLPELVEALGKLNDKGVDLTTTLELTDKKSVSAFNTFLRSADDVAVLREELEDTSGVLKTIAEERADTLAGSLDRLKSAWEGLILKFKNSTGTLKEITDMLGSLIQDLTPGHKLDYNAKANVDVALEANGGNLNNAIKSIQKKLFEANKKLENAEKKRELKYWQKQISYLEEALKRLRSEQDALKEDSSTTIEDNDPSKNGNGDGGDGDDDNKKKHKASWSLQSDKAFLAAKAELTRQFNEGEIKSQKEYDEQLYQLEVATLSARLSSRKDSSKDRLRIEVDLQEKIMKHKQSAAKEDADEKKKIEELEEKAMQARIAAAADYNEKADAQLEAENARFEKEKAQYEKKKDAIANYDLVVETLERQHTNNLLKIELDRQSAQVKQMEALHKRNLAEIQQAHEYELQLDTTSSARKLEIQKERNEAIAAENKRYLEEQYQFLQTIVSSGAVAGMSLTKEQLDQYKLQLEELSKQLPDADAALQNLTTSSAWSGSGDGSLFGVKQSDWEAFFQNFENGTLKAKDLQTVISGIGGAAQEGFKLANQAIQLTNAREKKALDDYKKGQDSKKKSLEERYKAGLMTEHQYNEEVERMEADMQAKQEEMELEQARRTKAMSIVESIINTALGVTKTLAQWGIPEGIAPAAIMAAMGAAQTAMIIAQPTGYAEGGNVQVKRSQDGRSFRAKVDPLKRGYVDCPTILVGEEGGEYVIPAEALKNPDIRLCVDAIESARRSGRLRSLRMEAVNPAAAAYSGRADGGYTREPAPSDVAAISTQTVQDIVRLRETVERLNGLLDAGIEAEVVMTGRNGLVRRFEEYNRMKERGQL